MKKFILLTAFIFLSNFTFAGNSPHHLGVVGAVTIHGKAYPTFGIDYTYQIAPQTVAMAFAEYIFASHPATIVGLGVGYDIGHVRLYGGGGIESSHGKTHPLVRLGTGYNMHVGSVSIFPHYAYDLIIGASNAHVIGVAIGIGI